MNKLNYSKLNINTGILYFFVHFIVEFISFAILGSRLVMGQAFLVAALFDFLAFMPQGLLGLFYEKHKKFKIGYIGMSFLAVAVVLCSFDSLFIFDIGIIFLAIGNALLHELAAIDTVVNSESKIFASTIFVGGGSFGLCLGKLYKFNLMWLLPAVVIGIILVKIGDKLRPSCFYEVDYKYPGFNVVKSNVLPLTVIFCVFLTTMIRGFTAYTIPTHWCDEVWEICLLYVFMGSGKVIGGFICDKFGYLKTAVISTIGAVPFLVFGNNNMLISVTGIFLFSMTMGISFASGLSVLKDSTALAFGVTTIGLVMGAAVNIFYIDDLLIGNIIICVTSVVCCLIFMRILKNGEESKNKEKENKRTDR